MIAKALGVEAVSSNAAEHRNGLTDHRYQADGAHEQPPAGGFGADVVQVAVKRLPMGFPLILWQLGGIAKRELSEAALVGTLL